MRRRLATAGLLLAVAASAASAQTPSAQTPAPASPPVRDTAELVMITLLSVCRPAAEQRLPASTFAERLGYTPDAKLPPGLPISRDGAMSWRVPNVAAEVHVVSGAMPEPAQQSACMVALYDDPAPGLEEALQTRLTAPDMAFQRDAAQSFTTDRYVVTHYDSHWGYLVRNIMALRPLKPAPGAPSFSIITFRVDYSWLKSTSP